MGGYFYQDLYRVPVFVFLFYQCFLTGLCRVRSQCGRPAPDHVWGTWGNHPAQRQLTRKQINQSTPGLSHLSASHVGGPPCPNPLSFMYEDRETRDKKKTELELESKKRDGGQLWEPHPTNTSFKSNTPHHKTLISQTYFNLSWCTCCCGTSKALQLETKKTECFVSWPSGYPIVLHLYYALYKSINQIHMYTDTLYCLHLCSRKGKLEVGLVW